MNVKCSNGGGRSFWRVRNRMGGVRDDHPTDPILVPRGVGAPLTGLEQSVLGVISVKKILSGGSWTTNLR